MPDWGMLFSLPHIGVVHCPEQHDGPCDDAEGCQCLQQALSLTAVMQATESYVVLPAHLGVLHWLAHHDRTSNDADLGCSDAACGSASCFENASPDNSYMPACSLPHLGVVHCLEQHDGPCDDAEGCQCLQQATNNACSHQHCGRGQVSQPAAAQQLVHAYQRSGCTASSSVQQNTPAVVTS
jgi:hypothetical protein